MPCATTYCRARVQACGPLVHSLRVLHLFGIFATSHEESVSITKKTTKRRRWSYGDSDFISRNGGQLPEDVEWLRSFLLILFVAGCGTCTIGWSRTSTKVTVGVRSTAFQNMASSFRPWGDHCVTSVIMWWS